MVTSVLYAGLASCAHAASRSFLTADGVAVWFPAAALSFAYLVHVGVRGAPIVFATRFVVGSVLLGGSFPRRDAAVAAALVTAVYAAAAAWVRPRLRGAPSSMASVAITAAAAGLASLAASIGVVGYLVAASPLAAERFVPTVLSFWLGDASAVLTLAPLLLAVTSPRWSRSCLWGRSRVEAVAHAATVLGAAWFAVHPDPHRPNFYITFVPLVWVALRRGLASVTAAMALTGLAVPLASLATGATVGDMTRVQLFLLVYGLTALVLGAEESDRRAAGERLLTSEAQLRDERDAARAAEELFRLSFEASPIGVALVGLDGRFLRVNDALCRIVGYGEEELLSRTFQEITHPDDLAEDLALLAQLDAGTIPKYSMEKRYLRPDGNVVTVQLDVTLVRDTGGERLHYIAQIQDVSERVAMLESLRAAEAVQRACIDALEEGVALSTLDGTVMLLNPAGERILGYDAQELTALFRARRWETYREDGMVLPEAERPLGHTMRTGEPVSGRIVVWRRADGRLVTLRVATQPVRDEHGRLCAVVTGFADITAERALQRAERESAARLAWLAYHDPLTGLPNRAMFLDRLASALDDRRPSGRLALLYIDLDNFKPVNDTMGHAAGDELLVAVAERLRDAVRSSDLVARLGGDEFVVLADRLRGPADAEVLAQRIADALEPPVLLAGVPVQVSASIGIAIDDGHTPDTLISDADTALYRVKHGGRAGHEVFVPTDTHPAMPRRGGAASGSSGGDTGEFRDLLRSEGSASSL